MNQVLRNPLPRKLSAHIPSAIFANFPAGLPIIPSTANQLESVLR